MKLPKDLKFEAVCFMRMGNGGHGQEYRNEKVGNTCSNFKQDRNHEWEKTFTVDRFPGKVFKTGREVTEAFENYERFIWKSFKGLG